MVHVAAGVFRPGLCLCDRSPQGVRQVPHGTPYIPLTVQGAGLLLVGWFGFNAGSALAANGVAVKRPAHHQYLRRLRRIGLDGPGLAGWAAQHPGDRPPAWWWGLAAV